MVYLCHMLHSSSSQTQFLSISFLSIIFGWFCMLCFLLWENGQYLHCSANKKNYQNIHLDHKGLSWKNKRCILLRMKYSIWYRQFNGISFGFGLDMLFGTKINICTGIMRIIQLCCAGIRTGKKSNSFAFFGVILSFVAVIFFFYFDDC